MKPTKSRNEVIKLLLETTNKLSARTKLSAVSSGLAEEILEMVVDGISEEIEGNHHTAALKHLSDSLNQKKISAILQKWMELEELYGSLPPGGSEFRKSISVKLLSIVKREWGKEAYDTLRKLV